MPPDLRDYLVSPYPGLGTRSTTCDLGFSRAFFTVVNRPLPALRPRGDVFGPFDFVATRYLLSAMGLVVMASLTGSIQKNTV